MSYQDRIKTLRTEVQQMVNDAKTQYADLEAKGDKATADERANLNNLIDAGQVKRQELDRLEQLDAADQYVNAPGAQAKARSGAQPQGRKTWGQRVVESEEFKRAEKGSTSSRPRMDRVNVKAVYGSTDAAGGALLQNVRVEDVAPPQRPPSILDLINVAQTNGDAVEYAELTTRTNNAAPVAEFTSGDFGLKPESDLVWALRTANVKTIATWVPTSRRILADVPRLQNTIDVELTEMLRITLENEVLSGAGTGEHFTGITATSGILTRTQASGSRSAVGDTVADTIRRGITDVMLQYYTPNAVVLNPTDAETVELQKDTTGQYVMVIDQPTGRIWRVALVQTAALTAKTGLVGDLMMAATLWDRQQTEIRVGEPNDFFLRNAVAVLAELRAAFAVTRPLAVQKQTYT